MSNSKNYSPEKLKEFREYMSVQTITEEVNQNLPVPRLEIRAFKIKKGLFGSEIISIYSMVRRNLMNEIQLSPIDYTKTTGPESLDDLTMPWRMGSDMLNDAWELKLPAYFIKPKSTQSLDLKDPSLALPLGLQRKIKEFKPNVQ